MSENKGNAVGNIETRDLTELSNRNDIIGLRALLFSEIRKLNGKVNKEELELAEIKNGLAQTIINSVKVEVLYRQQMKKDGAEQTVPFIEAVDKK